MDGAAGNSVALRQQATGFTLLEVMVSLAVLGMLLLALGQGVGFGLHAWGTQTRLIAANADLDETDRAFRRLVEHIDPVMDERRPPMEGARDRMAFHSDLPEAAGDLAGRRISAALGVDPAGRLVLRWTPGPHAEILVPQRAEDVVLATEMARLELSYYAAPRPGAPDGWGHDWNEQTLPVLIRAHLVFKPGDRRHWPDLVAAPSQEAPNQ